MMEFIFQHSSKLQAFIYICMNLAEALRFLRNLSKTYSSFQGKFHWNLTHFNPSVPFLPPENVRKPKVFLHFQEVQKQNSGLNSVKNIQSFYHVNLFAHQNVWYVLGAAKWLVKEKRPIFFVSLELGSSAISLNMLDQVSVNYFIFSTVSVTIGFLLVEN